MLGEFVDDYFVNVIDVFASSQSERKTPPFLWTWFFRCKMLSKQHGRRIAPKDQADGSPRKKFLLPYGNRLLAHRVNMKIQHSFQALFDCAVAVVVNSIQTLGMKHRSMRSGLLVYSRWYSTSNFGRFLMPSKQLATRAGKVWINVRRISSKPKQKSINFIATPIKSSRRTRRNLIR
ncbi:hypothetical protein GCK72_022764 [Caenorhabditis remanei]|uniref:Uncharacterized protein n=1 Tax=Caenorhabditis remanei TaxID=31234 RepID=A0A6A5FV86_CAERE|nr:hypothetical protein GCK72_022764 [Caenorhabditis remanei]KAF1746311.1 hypothetical protein GCK72_022764 [Caenorhabditis remanei]